MKVTWADLMTMLAALVVLAMAGAALTSCPARTVVMPPDSLEMWTDHPGEPDALERCQAVTQGETRCVVMTADALAWWMQRWETCAEDLARCTSRTEE